MSFHARSAFLAILLATAPVIADDGADPADPTELAIEALMEPAGPPASVWEVSIGADVSRGTYGAGAPTDVTYLPAGLSWRRDRWSLSLHGGYLEVKGPVDYASILDLTPGELAVLDLDDAPIASAGIADTAVAVRYGVLEALETGTFIDVGARLKLPTASRAKGLGDGKAAVDLHADLTQMVGAWSILLSGSYGFRHGAGVVRDTKSVSLGLGRFVTDRLNVGAVVDWRTSTQRGADAWEAMAYASYDLNERVSLTAYAVTGFSAASVGRQAGIRLAYRWR